jgi:hypothetical protein
MWQNNKAFTSSRTSLILLLLISVRLVPFNLLHYHNNQFANFDALINGAGHQSTEEAISNEVPYCAFHQFLSLTSNSFVLNVGVNLLKPARYDIVITTLVESESTYLHLDILNKGSPLLA